MATPTPVKGDIFEIPAKEVETIGLENAIYGFPVPKAVATMGEVLMKLCKQCGIKDPAGIDLGCGDGAVSRVLHRVMGCRWDGVELSGSRIDLGLEAMPEEAGTLFEGCLINDVNYHDYSLLYCNNVCFTSELMRRLEAKVAGEFTGIFLSFVTLTSLEVKRRSALIHTQVVETNWTKEGHKVYYYLIADK